MSQPQVCRFRALRLDYSSKLVRLLHLALRRRVQDSQLKLTGEGSGAGFKVYLGLESGFLESQGPLLSVPFLLFMSRS